MTAYPLATVVLLRPVLVWAEVSPNIMGSPLDPCQEYLPRAAYPAPARTTALAAPRLPLQTLPGLPAALH